MQRVSVGAKLLTTLGESSRLAGFGERGHHRSCPCMTSALTPVAFDVLGNGVNFELVLLVADGGVQAMWKNTEFDPH